MAGPRGPLGPPASPGPLAPLRAAVTLLTRVPWRTPPDEAPDPGAAWPWFPAVGAATGLAVAAVLLAAGHVLPAAVAAVIAVAVELLLTGALHLDGLADCADGAAGRDRAHRLRIMKDPAVGVYGVAAVALDLALKVTCLAALALRPAAEVLALVVLVWGVSRGAMVVPARLPYARPDGTGRLAVEGLTSARAAATGAVTTGLALVAGAAAGLSAGLVGVLAAVTTLVAAGLAALLAARAARSRLGGVTGDVLGATAEGALLVGLLGVLVVSGAA